MSNQPVNNFGDMSDSVTNTAPTNNQYNANNEWLPVVANGLGILGSTFGNWWASRKNLKYQQEQNARNLQTNWDMYWTNLNENRKNWNMQNEYNHPLQQMKRFQEAGLNPYLAITKGAQGADSVPASAPSNSGGQPAPKMDNQWMNPLISLGQMYMQAITTDAQTDNLRAQLELIRAQTGNTMQQTSRGAFDLSQLERLKDVHYEQEVQKYNQQILDALYQSNQDRRAELTTEQGLKEGLERILTSQLQRAKTQDERDHIKQLIENLKIDARIKEIDAQISELGARPGDSLWYRLLLNWLNSNSY